MAVRSEAHCRDPLLRGLDHEDSFIRWTSALALARLFGPASLAHLKHRAEEAADDLERSAILAASIRAGQTERVDALQESLQKTGQLPQLRSIWKAEILDALRLGRPAQPELFDAWQEQALLSERSLRYFQEWGQAATSVHVVGSALVNILLLHVLMDVPGIVPGLLATVCWLIVFFNVRSAFDGVFRR